MSLGLRGTQNSEAHFGIAFLIFLQRKRELQTFVN